jgi:hypothetical protein
MTLSTVRTATTLLDQQAAQDALGIPMTIVLQSTPFSVARPARHPHRRTGPQRSVPGRSPAVFAAWDLAFHCIGLTGLPQMMGTRSWPTGPIKGQAEHEREVGYNSHSDAAANIPDRRRPPITAGRQRWPSSGTPRPVAATGHDPGQRSKQDNAAVGLLGRRAVHGPGDAGSGPGRHTSGVIDPGLPLSLAGRRRVVCQPRPA